MRVAGMMSGSGSNLIKIIEHQKDLERERQKLPYEVVVIFSDNKESKAQEIGDKHNIPVIINDLKDFCEKRGRVKKDLSVRPEFDNETVKSLSTYYPDVLAYAGYMSIVTEELINTFLGINIHPADLSIEKNGERKYRGANSVRDAILAGEQYISSSTHIIESKVDDGRILMISPKLEVILDENFDKENMESVKAATETNQKRLKENGDWIIFPQTIEYLADGRYAMDLNGNLYCENRPIPSGLKI